jgi:hypothetical protein
MMSLVENRPPPATNGKFVPIPLIGTVLPASRPSANAFRPFNGSSTIFLFSITCPIEDVVESTSAAAAVTSTVSVNSPTFSVTS